MNVKFGHIESSNQWEQGVKTIPIFPPTSFIIVYLLPYQQLSKYFQWAFSFDVHSSVNQNSTSYELNSFIAYVFFSAAFA